MHVTNPLTSATANGASVNVENGSSTPPAPVDDVHEIDQSIVNRVEKW